MKYIPVLCASIMLFVPLFSVADPVIDEIDYEYSGEEGGIVIKGKRFGDFGGEILSWDDFEKHEPGDGIFGKRPLDGHTWTTIYNYKGQGVQVDRTRKVSGNNSLLLDWSKDAHTIRAFGWAEKGPYNELYISYWRHMEGNFDYAKDNHKQFYLYGSNNGFPQLMPLIPGGTKLWGVYNNVGDSNITYAQRNNINISGWDWENTAQRFNRWEFFLKLNAPHTESNGIIRVWMDGELGVENDNYRMAYVNGQFTDFRLGHMAQGFSATAKAWFDDVYIATTQARVEICNAAKYSNCTIKHLQYVSPIEWSRSKIVFKARNFEALKGYPVYVYVIDKNGNVSSGYPLPRPVMITN